MREKDNKNRGITLIALVVTIVVLLILAGISISMLTGQNGILNRAAEAKEKTEISNKEEQRKLAQAEALMNTEKTTYKGVTLPEGFAPTKIEGEDSIDGGLVITDGYGNEYVWVEVPIAEVFSGVSIENTKEMTDNDYKTIQGKLQEYVADYNNSSYYDVWYANDDGKTITEETDGLTERQKELKNGCGLSYYEYKSAYRSMLKSIYSYGGFWIGRYETGIYGSVTDTTIARISHTDVSVGTSPKGIVQKNAIPYNNIYCSEAQNIANEISTNSNYRSSLLFGIQWNLVCKYLENDTMLSIKSLNSDSSCFGNYSNKEITIKNLNAKKFKDDNWSKMDENKKEGSILLSTGASEYTKKMNIYDFAGNEWEWTLEKTQYVNFPCTSRGGNFSNSGEKTPAASYNNNSSINAGYTGIGFRVTIYEK